MEWAEIVARLTALHHPCPACGAALIGARIHQADRGAFIGMACPSCEECYTVPLCYTFTQETMELGV